MKRASIIGPLLLVAVGVLFLMNNLMPELPMVDFMVRSWPYILIGWGLLRLVEITIWQMRGSALPGRGVSGGEWFFIIFMSLVVMGLFHGTRFARDWPQKHIRIGGLEILGENHDFTFEEKKINAGKTPKVLVENWRGNARIAGADTEEITVTGRSTIRSMSQEEAKKAHARCALEVVKQGDLFVIRTNQDKATGIERVEANLEITVPRGASIDGRGRYGDFDISTVDGGVDINSDNAGVRLSDIGKDARIDLRRSDLVRATRIKGNVEVKGSGYNVELEQVQGTASVNGSFSGEILFRKVAKPVRFQSSSTELRVERADGELRFSRGELSGDQVTGPIYLRAHSKDVQFSNYTGALEIQTDRGDIELRPGQLPLSEISARTKSGDVVLALPDGAKFTLEASTDRGEVENDFGGALQKESSGRRASIKGSVANGPQVRVSTGRGTVMVRKASADLLPEPPAGVKAPKPPAPPVAPEVVRQ